MMIIPCFCYKAPKDAKLRVGVAGLLAVTAHKHCEILTRDPLSVTYWRWSTQKKKEKPVYCATEQWLVENLS